MLKITNFLLFPVILEVKEKLFLKLGLVVLGALRSFLVVCGTTFGCDRMFLFIVGRFWLLVLGRPWTLVVLGRSWSSLVVCGSTLVVPECSYLLLVAFGP